MTTITLNNENKTQIEFTYNNGLPYKKSIRPEIEYGEWTENENIALIKVKLSENDLSLIKNKNNIKCQRITKVKKELWFDLDDVYLVFETSSYLDKKIAEEKFILAFFNENELFSSWGFFK